MKKDGVLNSDLSRIIASMGHTDKLVICDVGLPIPRDAQVVDLALATNIPRFLDTLKVILKELAIEAAVITDELVSSGSALYREIKEQLPDIELKTVSHEEFKQLIKNNQNVSFVRTGEATPFANIILVSGVTFD